LIINNECWTINLVDPGDTVLCTGIYDCAFGVCDDNDKTIYILNNLTKEKMRKVLCHEIVHAAMFSYNINLDWWTEEIVADIIATYGDEITNKTDYIFECLIK
jgi:uncharacterized phage-like protein YoqJ